MLEYLRTYGKNWNSEKAHSKIRVTLCSQKMCFVLCTRRVIVVTCVLCMEEKLKYFKSFEIWF